MKKLRFDAETDEWSFGRYQNRPIHRGMADEDEKGVSGVGDHEGTRLLGLHPRRSPFVV